MKNLLIASVFTLFSNSVFADEGMWLPILLQQLNIKDMQQKGCHLSAEDIYSVNHSSMKDAVLLFGSGCTGEVISAEGLVLTNHHCGLGQIQSHSTVEHDYLKNGFWAMNKSEELTCPGLTVTFIVRMEDVTHQTLNNVTGGMDQINRQTTIEGNNKLIAQNAVKGTHYAAYVRSFYNGNQYYLFITETFRDVRLVGAPPEAIGNFGGDEDNWIWPRHTGDFSLFRIYADSNNNPADYSSHNFPFKPKYFFPISLKGVRENDFTMVYGFPGRTTEYISSYAVDVTQHISDPERVAIRDVRLKIWWDEMMKSDSVRIKYSSKYYGLSNAWKKWQGEIRGLNKADAVAKKAAYENIFTQRINSNTQWKNEYGNLLPRLKQCYDSMSMLLPAVNYYSEALMTPEIFKVALAMKPLTDAASIQAANDAEITGTVLKIKNGLTGFYKDYYAPADQEMTAAMVNLFEKNVGSIYEPGLLTSWNQKYFSNDAGKWLFDKSMLDNDSLTLGFLNTFKIGQETKIINDPVYQFAISLSDYYDSIISPPYQRLNEEINLLNREYMKAQMEVFPEKRFYPDANLTLRISYGAIKGYKPTDAVTYNYFTTLDGVMDKYKPNDEFYDAPKKLINLYHKKDYGDYADTDGTLHTDFIASNHTTGGNSGSPVIDGDGNLIGTNFDRWWEGTMSDIYFDPDECRNIALDVRYTLFIIDKFAGAGYLLKEMKITR
ncbi:MAG: S46 family peptidase [Chitinophagales bacterium]|nr:S46 family peptidase [Chitinophagales bacterium]